VAKAIRYLLSHWDGLCVFLTDGRVELDTNTIERLHRIVAMMRSLCPHSSSIWKH
jgi:hypothetical protein